MLMTVGQLKTLIKNLDDDMLFTIMEPENNYELKSLCPKRGLILEADDQNKLFCLNNMGTHWRKEWEDKNFVKLIGSIDKDTGEIKMI